jgi:GDP-L-fucose synthase
MPAIRHGVGGRKRQQPYQRGESGGEHDCEKESREGGHGSGRVRRPLPPQTHSFAIRTNYRPAFGDNQGLEFEQKGAILEEMDVLVTGGGGFLGSYVVAQLRRRGVEPTVPRSHDYDLTSPSDTERLFEDARPELVFHLAAEVGGIGANRANPGRFWYANLLMGTHVLEQSRRAGVGKLVLVGTICAYPKFAPVPFREDDLWNGYPEETNAPYGVAKKALLVGAQAYREQYGLNSIYLLPVNLYGPGDKVDLADSHVIPALIRKMIEAQEADESEIVLWGDGSPTREFLYVEDCAEGIVLAADRYDAPEPVNLGTGDEISIRDLAILVAELTGYEGKIVWDTSKPNGQPRRRLDTSLAATRFGFRASTSLRDGLERTIAWYRSAASALVPD